MGKEWKRISVDKVDLSPRRKKTKIIEVLSELFETDNVKTKYINKAIEFVNTDNNQEFSIGNLKLIKDENQVHFILIKKSAPWLWLLLLALPLLLAGIIINFERNSAGDYNLQPTTRPVNDRTTTITTTRVQEFEPPEGIRPTTTTRVA